MSLYELSATEIIAKIKEKNVTCVEVATSFIERIKIVNPHINAIHQFEPNRILAEAEKKDQDIFAGNKLGKLHGLPISIKDTCYVKGFIGCKGSQLFPQTPAIKNATVVERLLCEGAIVLGITNVPEMLAAYETDNLIHGRTNNPYDLARTPGGSSGGESALIAAGSSSLGIGSDSGGSIRVPAHYTGIAGHRPTKGLVPISGIGGDIPVNQRGLKGQLSCIGPLARHVEDLILALEVMAGPDDYDYYTAPVKLENPYDVNLAQLKIAYFIDNGIVTPSEETALTIHTVIKELESMVFSIEEQTPPNMKSAPSLILETFFSHGDGGKTFSDSFSQIGIDQISPLYRASYERAKRCHLSVADLRARLVELDKFRIKMHEFISRFDILICPVSATPARLHGTTAANYLEFMYSKILSMTGWPVTVVRCGTSREGLPIGIQIVAKPWRDHVSLAVGYRLQKIFGGLGPTDIKTHQQSKIITST